MLEQVAICIAKTINISQKNMWQKIYLLYDVMNISNLKMIKIAEYGDTIVCENFIAIWHVWKQQTHCAPLVTVQQNTLTCPTHADNIWAELQQQDIMVIFIS